MKIKYFLVSYIIFFININAYSSVQGPNGPNTANNLTFTGSSYSWLSLDDVKSENGIYTYTNIPKNKYSNYLYISNFGFNIPSNIAINGIKVEVINIATARDTRDYVVKLVKGGVISGINKAKTGANWPTSASKTITYGSSTDLWGITFTNNDINASDFGVVISVRNKKRTSTAKVDYVRISVYYDLNLFYSKSSGDLSLLSTWGKSIDGSGLNPLTFNSPGQIFVLRNRTSATLINNLNIGGDGSKLVVGNGSIGTTFTIPSNFSYSGFLDAAINSTVNIQNSNSPYFDFLDSNSTINYNGSNQGIYPAEYYNLNLSGSGTKTVGSFLDIPSGTGQFSVINLLTVSSGVILVNTSDTINIYGNLSNSGTIQGSGFVNFIGNNSQIISGSNGTIENFEIDNDAGVSLSGLQSLSGYLILSEGIFSSSTNLTPLNSSTIIRALGSITGTLQGINYYDVNYIDSAKTTGIEVNSSGLRSVSVNLTDSLNSLLTLGSSISLNGNLNIISGSLDVSSSNYSLNIAGNLVNNGIFIQRTGTVSFIGTTVQSVSGSAQTVFYNLSLNNTNDMEFPGFTTVNGTLNLVNGKIKLFDNDFVLAAGSTITGVSPAKYLFTSGIGNLTRLNIGASATVFPVGTSTSYNPVTVTNNGTVDKFSVRVKTGYDYTPPDPLKVVNRQWTITEGNLGGSNVLINFQFNSGEWNSSFNPAGPVNVGKWNGTGWEAFTANMTGSGPYSISNTPSSSISTFSTFMVGNEGALPVSLLYFNSSVTSSDVNLKWATSWELNNKGFEVERLKQTQGSWEKAGFVKGSGTTNEVKEYVYKDNHIDIGIYKYRLKQIDYSGNFEYIELVGNVSVKAPEKFELYQNYPNPSNPVSKIDYNLPENGKTELKVYDLNGRELMTLVNNVQPAGFYSVEFNGNSLASGVYLYRINIKTATNNYQKVMKIVLIK